MSVDAPTRDAGLGMDLSAVPGPDGLRLLRLRTLLGSADPAQRWVDAYRYRLACKAYLPNMAYHRHLRASPAAVRPAFRLTAANTGRQEVWDYCKETSCGGPFRLQLRQDACRAAWVGEDVCGTARRRTGPCSWCNAGPKPRDLRPLE